MALHRPVYRCLIEGLFGVKGCPQGLQFNPQLPSHWPGVELERAFRGAHFSINIRRQADLTAAQLIVNGETQADMVFSNIMPGQRYQVNVLLPA